jgi:SpoVK/Ycf46/Vps4 family AAA+-type ATPase
MNSELVFHLRSLTRCIYYVCDEEDELLKEMESTLQKHRARMWVFNAAFGMVPLTQLTANWRQRTNMQPVADNIQAAMDQIYRDDPRDEQNFYIITDPDRWLKDENIVRRLLNVIHHLHNDIQTIKILLFVGSRRVIPEKLSRYMEVVTDKGLPAERIESLVTETCKHLKRPVPHDPVKLFRGLTAYEIEASIAQAVIHTKKDPQGSRVDPSYISDYRRRQLAKTDLVSYLDTSRCSFDQVGGQARFKEWAMKTRNAWTSEGQKFGLRPPKGVLCVGVWGCGKSLSVKAMGNAWKLPVVQMEMGRLRSSGVGESEANVYRALRIVESVAPCIVLIDEAEKSLSGNQSSANSDAGTTSRTIGILSTWLQETEAPVTFAMTANSLKTLPVEFVNRMDERFFFDLPSEEERVDILKIHLLKAKQDASKFNLAVLAEKARSMVGREIEQSIYAALVDSFDKGAPALDEAILSDQLSRKPRIYKTMADELKEVLTWVGYDEEVDEGIRARFASAKRSETWKLLKDGSSDG